jgi:hypothetical protein
MANIAALLDKNCPFHGNAIFCSFFDLSVAFVLPKRRRVPYKGIYLLIKIININNGLCEISQK